MDQQEDLFDSLLSLEETSYRSGYAEGYADGQRQARVEARLFGVQTAFEKFATIGRMHARAQLWATRLEMDEPATENGSSESTYNLRLVEGEDDQKLPALSSNLRLKRHLETLLSLLDPKLLPLDNSDASVSEIDVRLRRAQAKEKVVEKMIGEESIASEPLEVDVSLEQHQQKRTSSKPHHSNDQLEDFGAQ